MLLQRAKTAWSDWRERNTRQPHGWRRRQRRPGGVSLPNDTLKLLSFNVQAGIGTQRFHDYITGSWKHLLAHPRSVQNIEDIAGVVSDYDVVMLQEVDGGSLRSKNLNQVVHLATLGDFPFWHQQLNRNLGRFGQFSNGLLSRLTPYHVEDHRLPGLPGRGAVLVKFGHPDDPLVLVGVHLALSERARNQQLDYLCGHLKNDRHVVMMGDFNCLPEDLARSPVRDLGLTPSGADLFSYPSWRPDRPIDHILVSDSLSVTRASVLSECRLSDHLPVATEVRLPGSVVEAAEHAQLALEGRKLL